jgi:hypothetical protein
MLITDLCKQLKSFFATKGTAEESIRAVVTLLFYILPILFFLKNVAHMHAYHALFHGPSVRDASVGLTSQDNMSAKLLLILRNYDIWR